MSDIIKKDMLKMYEYAVLKRNPDDMPIFKKSRNEKKKKKLVGIGLIILTLKTKLSNSYYY